MHTRNRELAPGTIEAWFELDHIESAQLFSLLLISMLGPVVYL
jgi:hypothetical protein